MKYIVRKFPTYGLPPEALIEVRNLSFSEAARWSNAGNVANWIDPKARGAHLSRSFAPPMPTEERKVPLTLEEGDEARILAPANKHEQPKSVADLRYTWIRVRKISETD